jgi:hypothetical protein
MLRFLRNEKHKNEFHRNWMGILQNSYGLESCKIPMIFLQSKEALKVLVIHPTGSVTTHSEKTKNELMQYNISNKSLKCYCY